MKHGEHDDDVVVEEPPAETKLEPPKDRYQGIRCPRCFWRPEASSRWQCRRPCFHVWNTFDTRGRCPACSYQWLETQCLKCLTMSPHEAWYEPGGGGAA